MRERTESQHLLQQLHSTLGNFHAMLGLALLLAAPPAPAASTLLTLDNGVIKVGVDTAYGGAITYLSLSGSTNLINSHDPGREVQQSYYSGPTNFVPNGVTQNASWSPWPWNPIQAGDSFGYRAAVLATNVTNGVLYVKTLPMQWALKNYPGDCFFETWLRLEGAAVRAHCRLTSQRSDLTQYAARSQELPAVYGVGTLNHLFSYVGTNPFANDPLTEVTTNGPPWNAWRATENWSAMVNGANFGIGIHHPDAVYHIGGYASSGNPGTGDPSAFNTAYLAPIHAELLDANLVYDYDFNLIVGSLAQIRAWAYTNALDHRPDYHFAADRQHWAPAISLGDAGPPAGFLRLNVGGSDPQLVGPYCAFAAAAVPKVYFAVRYNLATPPGSQTAQLFWETNNVAGFTGARVQNVTVTPSAGWKIYAFNVSNNATWTGLISRLRLDIMTGSSTSNDTADLAAISWTNTPPTLSPFANLAVLAGTTSAPVSFAVSDDLLPAEGLQISLASSAPSLLPTNRIFLSGAGAARALQVAPLSGQSGTATVTVTVSDTLTNTSQAFTVKVLGTQPRLEMLAAGAMPNGSSLLLTGVAGAYALERSASLTNWQTVSTNLNSNGAVQLSDPTATNAPRRFYRARVVP